MTVLDLLNKQGLPTNKSLLARELHISRNTLDKYLADTDGEQHIIRKMRGEYVLFGILTKVSK